MINLSGADSLAEHRYPIAFQIGERGLPAGGREHDRLPDEHAIVRPHETSRCASRPIPRE